MKSGKFSKDKAAENFRLFGESYDSRREKVKEKKICSFVPLSSTYLGCILNI
jgi:hypothetical protein